MGLRKKTTYEMVELYRQGVPQVRLAEIYGVSASSVSQRLKKMGCLRAVQRLDSIVPAVDKNRLAALYTDERRSSYASIGAELEISVKALRLALKFQGVPKRPTAYL